MIRGLVLTAIFLAALFGCGTLLCEVQPFAAVPQVREKAAHFAAHADDYDTLFIGTSRVYRGLNPALFDDLTAQGGVPTHSFNFGIDAMSPPEDAYVFEHLVARPSRHLKWVLIELGMIRQGVGLSGAGTVRSLHWHDGARTLLACRSLLANPDSMRPASRSDVNAGEGRSRFSRVLTHLRLWAQRTLAGGGCGLDFAARLQPPPRVNWKSILGSNVAGFVPAGEDRAMSENERAEYQRRFAERMAGPLDRVSLDVFAQQNLDVMLTRIRALGARPILLIPPALNTPRLYPQPGRDAPVLDFSSIADWPELFRIEHRTDVSHLNAAGAEIFTRAVAAQFLELARPSR